MPLWTPTQKKIIKILADGQPHRKEELADCLNDELQNPNNIISHIVQIRRKLQPIGQDIVSRRVAGGGRTLFYQHVILLSTKEG